MKKQIIFSAAILFILSQTNLSAQNAGVSQNQDEQETALEAGISELGQPKTAELEIDRTKAVRINTVEPNRFASENQDEQQTAFEAGIRELGQPKTAELEIDRTKAVRINVTDNNHFSPEQVAALRIALSDESMGRLKMTCASR